MLSTWDLLGHGLWIVGLALLLAIGSFRSWQRSQLAPHLNPAMDQAQDWLSFGLLLVSSGLLIVSDAWFERVLWAVISLILFVGLSHSVWQSYQQRQVQSPIEPLPHGERPANLARRLWSTPATRWSIGTLVSAGALYLAFRGVDYSSVVHTLLRANTTFILLALLSVAVNTLAKAVRWRVLIGKQSIPIPLREVLRVLLIGQMLNTIIPARVGELSRAYLLGRQGLGASFILGTVALEKLIDMIVYVVLFLLLVLLMPVPDWISRPIYPFALVALSTLLVTLLMSRYQHQLLGLMTRLLHWLPQPLQQRITRLVGSALSSLSILRDWRSSLKVSWWSVIVWLAAVLTNYLVLLALGIAAPPPTALLVLVVLQAGIAIPSVPGKIGVFQYLCVLALGVFAVDQTTALSYGILLHAIVFLPTTAIGVILLWTSGLSLRQTVVAGSPSNGLVSPPSKQP